MHAGSKGDTEKAGEEDGTANGANRFSSQILAQNAPDDAGEDCGEHLKTRWTGKSVKRLQELVRSVPSHEISSSVKPNPPSSELFLS